MGGAEESAHPKSSGLRSQTSTRQNDSFDMSSEQAEVGGNQHSVSNDSSTMQRVGKIKPKLQVQLPIDAPTADAVSTIPSKRLPRARSRSLCVTGTSRDSDPAEAWSPPRMPSASSLRAATLERLLSEAPGAAAGATGRAGGRAGGPELSRCRAYSIARMERRRSFEAAAEPHGARAWSSRAEAATDGSKVAEPLTSPMNRPALGDKAPPATKTEDLELETHTIPQVSLLGPMAGFFPWISRTASVVMGDGKEIARLMEAELANTPDSAGHHHHHPHHKRRRSNRPTHSALPEKLNCSWEEDSKELPEGMRYLTASAGEAVARSASPDAGRGMALPSPYAKPRKRHEPKGGVVCRQSRERLANTESQNEELRELDMELGGTGELVPDVQTWLKDTQGNAVALTRLAQPPNMRSPSTDDDPPAQAAGLSILGGQMPVSPQASLSDASAKSFSTSVSSPTFMYRSAMIVPQNQAGKATWLTVRSLFGTTRVWMMNPHCSIRSWIDIVMIVLVMYSLLQVPFCAAFFEYRGQLDTHAPRSLVVSDVIIDVVFMMDIVMELNTGIFFTAHEGYVVDRRVVAKTYLRRTLIIDIITSLPLELVFPENQRSLVRLIKMLRVTRLRDFGRGGKLVYSRNVDHFLRLTNILLQFVYMTHFAGCVLFALSRSNKFDPRTWAAQYGLHEDEMWTQAIKSFFYALTLTGGLGNSPAPPILKDEVAFVCLTMIVGTAFLSFAIANMFDLISSIKRKNNLYDSNVDQLKYWLEHKKIPKNTQRIVLRHFNYQYSRHHFVDDDTVLNMLSPGLQLILRRFLCRDVVKNITIFQDSSDAFVDQLVNHLKAKFVTSGEIVCRQEEMGNEMFIVSKGEIAVMRFFSEEECEGNQSAMRSHFNSISSMDHTDNKRRLSSKDSAIQDRAAGTKFTYITVLTKGNVFGEISVIFDVPRICTCRAIVQSDLFTLSKEDFFTTVGAWPDEFDRICEIANERAIMTQGTDFRRLREEVLGEDEEDMPADLDLDTMEMATRQASRVSHAVAANLPSPALSSYCGVDFDPETAPTVLPITALDLAGTVPNRFARRNSLVHQNVPSIAQEYRRRRRSSMTGGHINMSASADHVPSSPTARAVLPAGKDLELSPYLAHLPALGRSGRKAGGSFSTSEQPVTRDSSFTAAVGKVQRAQKFAVVTGTLGSVPSLAQEYRRRRSSLHAPLLQGSAMPPPGLEEDCANVADATSLAEAASMALAQMSLGATPAGGNPKPQVSEMAQLYRRYRRNSMSRLGQDRSQWVTTKTTSSPPGEASLTEQNDIIMHASAPPTPQQLEQHETLNATHKGRSLGTTLPDLDRKEQVDVPVNPYTHSQRRGPARRNSMPSDLDIAAKHTQTLCNPLVGKAFTRLEESSSRRRESSHGNMGLPREIEDADLSANCSRTTWQARNMVRGGDARPVLASGTAVHAASHMEVAVDVQAPASMPAGSLEHLLSQISPDTTRNAHAEMHGAAVADEIVEVSTLRRSISSTQSLSHQEPVQNHSTTFRGGEARCHSALQLSVPSEDIKQEDVLDTFAPSSSSGLEDSDTRGNPSDAGKERENPIWYNAMSGEPISDQSFRGNKNDEVTPPASHDDSKSVAAISNLPLSRMSTAQQSEDRPKQSQGPAQGWEMEEDFRHSLSVQRSKNKGAAANQSRSCSEDIAEEQLDASAGDLLGKHHNGLAVQDAKELTPTADLSSQSTSAGSVTSLNHLSHAEKQGSSPGVSNPLLSNLMGKILDTKVGRSPRTVSGFPGGLRRLHQHSMQIETRVDPEELNLEFMYNLSSPADSLHVPLESGIDTSRGSLAMNTPVPNAGSSTGMVGTEDNTLRASGPETETNTQERSIPVVAQSEEGVSHLLDRPTRDPGLLSCRDELSDDIHSQPFDPNQPTANNIVPEVTQNLQSAIPRQVSQEFRRNSNAISSSDPDRQRRWSMERDDPSGPVPINSRESETRCAIGTSDLPNKVKLGDCLQRKLMSLNLSNETDLAQIQSLLITFAAELIDIMNSDGSD